MSVAILCPTRRPDRFGEMLDSFLRTSTTATLIAYIDDDMKGEYEGFEHPRLVKHHGASKLGPVVCANVLVEAYREFDIYGFVPDDSTFKTPGWDSYTEEVFAQYPDRILILSPKHNYGKYVNFPVVSRRWIDILGWFAYPGAFHFCWDTMLELLGDATRIVFADPLKFFMHHEIKEEPFNYTGLELDLRKFIAWVVLERRSLIEKLQGAMREPVRD